MTFRPEPNQELQIGDTKYRIAEHPAAPGMPYGQEGRAAVVYQLIAGDKRRALKVFKPRFRVPALVALAGRLGAFADLPGLAVCLRTVLTPQQHSALLRQNPDLIYAMLMPWIDGPTWMEVLLDKPQMPPEQSLSLARSMVEVLSGMESRGLAHCDLSGPNLLLPALALAPNVGAQFPVELVDVEQMYGLGLGKPDVLPGGSQGYAHKTAPEGLWEPEADRFAGAILLVEMLGWCDERVRGAAWGENYFDPAELQQPCERYNLITGVLTERWGPALTRLFEQAWASQTLYDCPSFRQWLTALQATELARHTDGAATAPLAQAGATTPMAQTTAPIMTSPDSRGTEAALAGLLAAAAAAAAQGNLAEALGNYREARSLAPQGSPQAGEIAAHIADLEKRQAAERPTLAAPVVPAVAQANAAPPTAPAIPITAPILAQPNPQTTPQGSNQPANTTQQAMGAPSGPPQPAMGAPVFVPPVTPLDRMFDDAMIAFEHGDLPRADWLLREIVRQQPAFSRNGYLASRVLMDVDGRMRAAGYTPGVAPPAGPPAQGGFRQPPPPTGPVPVATNINRPAPPPRRNMVWVIPVIILLLLLLGGGGFFAMNVLGTSTSATPTPTLPAVIVASETPTTEAVDFSPTAEATDTVEAVVPPTDTVAPEPTDTPEPTYTPEPTDTPVPAPPTDTPVPPAPPTNTPVPPPPPPPPTNTRVVPPTAAPRPPTNTRVPPTNTRPPQPTRTPLPTRPPRPTNTPRPAPTNTPVVHSFAVTHVSVTAQPQHSTTCPTYFQFAASITTNNAGLITYYWERSDGEATPPETLYFGAAGTQLATNSWEVSATYTGWERLVVTAPNSVASNNGDFTLTCH